MPPTPTPTPMIPTPTPTAPGFPLLTRMSRAVQAKLDALVTSGDLAEAQRPARTGIPNNPGHRAVVLLQGDPQLPEQQEYENTELKTLVQPFEIYCFARPDDASTAPVDDVLNEMEAVIVYALMADFRNNAPLLGGLADNMWFDPHSHFNPSAAVAGRILRCMVQYHHRESDPYTQQ